MELAGKYGDYVNCLFLADCLVEGGWVICCKSLSLQIVGEVLYWCYHKLFGYWENYKVLYITWARRVNSIGSMP